MLTNLKYRSLIVVAALSSPGITPISSNQVCADEKVSVQLKDGQTIGGAVDVRTNDKKLWVWKSRRNIVISSGFDWEQVVGARVGSQEIPRDQLRARISKLKSAPPKLFFPAERKPDQSDRPSKAQSRPRTQMGLGRKPVDRIDQTKRRVRSLEIEAAVENWDDDVEPDGLRVFVSPLDATGDVVPVTGSLDFKLLGQNISTPQNRRMGQTRLFRELGRWSRRVRAADLQDGGAVFELPFANVHPEFDLDVASPALLTARLGVSGQGTFDATDANVRLRSPSRIRDELQLHTGNRFSPVERTRRFGR